MIRGNERVTEEWSFTEMDDEATGTDGLQTMDALDQHHRVSCGHQTENVHVCKHTQTLALTLNTH